MNDWQLPEGIDELSGEQALAFEVIRRKLLDFYISKDFSLVIPPMVEHLESLLLNSDSINEKTFKLLDPASGKTLGVHADITPQIARIDAKQGSTKQERYCYVNAILQTKTDDFYASRSPIQAGAELYGATDISADIEMIELLLESLKLLSISPIVLSLGNVMIFESLIKQEDLSDLQISHLRQIFSRRSVPDLAVFLASNSLVNADKFTALMELEGGIDVLNDALVIFNELPEAKSAIKDLIQIQLALSKQDLEIVIDLAQLQTYEYHTGVVFAAYNQNYAKVLAQGGRYNHIGQSFFNSKINRAATGFSFDLKFLSQSKLA